MKPLRIYYFGFVNTVGYCADRGLHLYVGAATNKMIAVAKSLRAKKVQAVLVTLPNLDGSNSISQVGGLSRRDGIPVIYFASHRYFFFRKCIGFFSFTLFSFKYIKPGERVILYNHALEYIFALFILRIRGVSVVQDIEDLPNRDEYGLRGILSRFAFFLTVKLTSSSKIVASEQIAKILGLQKYIVIYGICSRPMRSVGEKKWSDLLRGGALRVHYGGSIKESTGSRLFCDTLLALDQTLSYSHRKIQFVCTGLGDLSSVRAVQIRLVHLELEIYEGARPELFESLLRSCHLGLSLRLPTADYAHATFPSKVIEIASSGLALISTTVSDLELIFDERSAYFVREVQADYLSSLISDIANNPSLLRAHAEAAEQVVRSRFSEMIVGDSLKSFLLGSSSVR
jgi:glycosyltransferase involved in cell wall biosynthesis